MKLSKKERTIAKKLAENTSISSTTPGLTREEWLEGVAVGFRDNTLVLDQFLPERAVNKDSAKYRIYSARGYFKSAPTRGETALPEQAALQYSSDTYTTEEYAIEGWVSDDARRNAASDIEPFTDEAEFQAAKVNLTQEILIITEILTAVKAGGGTYYTSLGATENWNGGATSDILSDISTAIKAIVASIGKRPDKMGLDTNTYEAVINNSGITTILQNTSSAQITDGMPIKTLRGLKLVLADAVVNIGTLDSPTYSNILYDVDTATPLKQSVVISYSGNDRLALGRNFVSKPFRVFRGRGLEGDRRQSDLIMTYKKFSPKVQNVGAVHVIGKVLG